MAATVSAAPGVAEHSAPADAMIDRRRWTADEYHRMVGAGILREGERVELIGGEIVRMAAIGANHYWSVARLADHARAQLGETVFVNVQGPIRLSDDGEPEPDIAVVRRAAPQTIVPVAADVVLVVEVADSDPSLAYDRRVKLPRYAAAAIPEAWLVDLDAGTVEPFTDPRDGRYRQTLLGRRGETLPSTVLPALTVPVSVALGEARA